MKCTKVLYTESFLKNRVSLKIIVYLAVTPRGLVHIHEVAQKCLQMSTRLYGVTSQKTVNFIITA
jgi:hypothetical protein